MIRQFIYLFFYRLTDIQNQKENEKGLYNSIHFSIKKIYQLQGCYENGCFCHGCVDFKTVNFSKISFDFSTYCIL